MDVYERIEQIIKLEGGYVDHPLDRGGPTNWGITQACARACGYHGAMESLSRNRATQIYLDQYWFRPGFNRVWSLSPAVANEMLDTGINMGLVVAVKFLQRALNVLNRQGTLYAENKVDGLIGYNTLAALEAYMKHRGKAGERVLLAALNAQQGARYIAIAEADQTQEEFIFGWLQARVEMTEAAL